MLSPRPRGQKPAAQREQYEEAGEVDGATTFTSSVSSGNGGFLKGEVKEGLNNSDNSVKQTSLESSHSMKVNQDFM